MTDRETAFFESLTDDQLGAALKSVRADLFPATPPLATSVARRLEATEPRRGLLGASRSGLWAAAAMLALLLVGPFFFSPSLREAAADLFGVPGVEITVIEKQPAAELSPPELGTESDLGSVRSQASFTIGVPQLLGAPDKVFFDEGVAGGLVSLVYAASPSLPEAEETGVGLLVMEFEGTIDGSFMKKLGGPETDLELVTVGGASAYWLSGAPHPFSYEAADGTRAEVPARLAANTLLFTRRGVTYRIEGDIPLRRALALANSIR